MISEASKAIVKVTLRDPNRWASLGIRNPASKMPTGAIAELNPIVLALIPQRSIFRASKGNISPSEKLKTATVAQAAIRLRQCMAALLMTAASRVYRPKQTASA
jgi:hypothetical protein